MFLVKLIDKWKENKKILNKDLIYRKYFLKNELKKIILKSIIQNKNVTPIIRFNAKFKLIL